MTQTIEEPRAMVPANGNRETAVARRVVIDDSVIANLMDTARFEHLQRVSMMMANSSLLPNHLRFVKGKESEGELPREVIAANCFRITNQALRWGMDPFAIVDETYVVGGKLAYQGKLVAAVVNSRAGLAGRLRYEFSGQANDLTVAVIGRFKDEDEERSATLKLGDARTENQMWRKDPEQKLIYSGVVKWARRYCPEIVLGVVTDDDVERMQSTEKQPGDSMNDRLAKLEHQNNRAVSSLPVNVPLNQHDASVSSSATPSPSESAAAPSSEAAATVQVDVPVAQLGDGVSIPVMTVEESVSPEKSWERFESMAAAKNVAPAKFEAAMKAVCQSRGGFKKVSPAFRRDVFNAMAADKFDWEAGKLLD